MPARIFNSRKKRDFVTLLEWMNRVPPWKCRAMAVRKDRSRKATVKITIPELVRLSGIPARSFTKLSYRKDWAGVNIDVASRFAYACGVNVLAKKPESRFIERNFKPGLPYFNKRQRKAFDRAAKL